MHKHYSLSSIFKTTIFVLFLFGSGYRLSAQQSSAPLSEQQLADLISQNQKNGLAPFYQITEQYAISFDDAELAAKYKEQITESIQSMSGVKYCSMDVSAKILYVAFPKETEKEHAPEHMAEVKSRMDTYHLRFTSYKAATYHN